MKFRLSPFSQKKNKTLNNSNAENAKQNLNIDVATIDQFYRDEIRSNTNNVFCG